ncbi:MAG: HEAT repeat domain-containing protein [Fimbriimonas sp.]
MGFRPLRSTIGALALCGTTAGAQSALLPFPKAIDLAVRTSPGLRQAIEARALRALKEEDAAARRYAARALGMSGHVRLGKYTVEPPESVQARQTLARALAEAAEDSDPSVSRAAVRALARLLRNRQWGQHGEPWTPEGDAIPLYGLGKKATPALLELLGEPNVDHGTRITILRALRRQPDPSMTEPLLEFSKGTRTFELREALRVLSLLDDPRVLPAIADRLDDYLTEIGDATAAWVLEKKYGRRAIPEVMRVAASHSEANARYHALQYLRQFSDPAVKVAYIQGAFDPEEFVRDAAMASLRVASPSELPVALRACLLDAVPAVRAEACTALGRLKVKAAAGAIRRLLKDPDPGVRSKAQAALLQLR